MLNIRGIGHPRGLQRTRNASLESKIKLNFKIYIHICIFIFIFITGYYQAIINVAQVVTFTKNSFTEVKRNNKGP